MSTLNFNNEDYAQIKSAHISRGILFEDENFPNTPENVDSLSGKIPSPPEFKRIKDISEEAVIKAEGPPSAICLGSLTNINLILAMSVIAERSKILENVCMQIFYFIPSSSCFQI